MQKLLSQTQILSIISNNGKGIQLQAKQFVFYLNILYLVHLTLKIPF